MPEPTPGAHPKSADAAIGVTAVMGIVAALPEEVADLRSALRDVRCLHRQQPVIMTGELDGAPIALAITGDGARNARAGATALLATRPVRRLLAIGVSGALCPELGLSDLLVAERVVAEHAAPLQPTAALTALAERELSARRALLVSNGRIADTPAEKQRLRGLHAADGCMAAVDLESSSYAAVAHAAAIPWTILRAISDTADEHLPAVLNRSLSTSGSVSRARVVRALLGEPSALPSLLRLRRRVEQCSASLARAAAIFIRAVNAADIAHTAARPDRARNRAEDLT